MPALRYEGVFLEVVGGGGDGLEGGEVAELVLFDDRPLHAGGGGGLEGFADGDHAGAHGGEVVALVEAGEVLDVDGGDAGSVAAEDAGGVFLAKGDPADVEFEVQGGRVGVGGEEVEGVDAAEGFEKLVFVVVVAEGEALGGEGGADFIVEVGVGEDGRAGVHGGVPDGDLGGLEELGAGDGLGEFVAEVFAAAAEGENAEA